MNVSFVDWALTQFCRLLLIYLNVILWQISARMTRSSMIGDASSESSQVLWSTIVDLPPIMISEVYSSMARLLSPTYGTYLITTCKTKSFVWLYNIYGWQDIHVKETFMYDGTIRSVHRIFSLDLCNMWTWLIQICSKRNCQKPLSTYTVIRFFPRSV